MNTTTSTTAVLEARGLTKSYGRVEALRGSSLTLLAGEVLAVIGDNGAGKSTLIKCLCGAVQPDAGELILDGATVSWSSPQDARDHGIETVHQVLGVAPSMDIASNLYLGREVRRRGVLGRVFRMLDRPTMEDSARRELERLGIQTIQNPRQIVETLSGGQRQAVAVARAALFGNRVIIMDEPTAALGVRESNAVLSMIDRLRADGRAVILISHDMPHVFEIADRIQIQRLGRDVAVVRPDEVTMTDAVAIMTGASGPAE
jgi:fructose transport system ATP-binding protein